MCSLDLLTEMCAIWASMPQFLGHFGPQSKAKFWTLVTFSNNFHCFHISMASYAHFRCVWNMGLIGPVLGPFWVHFGSQNESKFRSLVIFSKSVWLDRFTSVLLHMFIASTFRCVENMGPRGPIWGLQNTYKFGCLVIFSNIFHWFRISLDSHVNLSHF